MTGPPGKRSARPRQGSSASKEIAADHSDGSKHTRPARRRSRRQPGLIPIGQIAAEVVADMKFRRRVERVHRLGPRAMAELLAEIGAERSIATIIDRKLDIYAGLDLAAIEVTGGDTFWPMPLRVVRP